ncbi:MAG: SufD family Fe-S cluster assembly protein [Lachnospiraceae bacterium]|nr:SufD family Fe-S cluster assembly protein [Lachnospiraceae bacterium]
MLSNDHLPARTWEWLKVNDIDLKEANGLIGSAPVNEHVIASGQTGKTPMYLDCKVGDAGRQASLHNFVIGAGSVCTVIQFITSGDGDISSGEYVLQNRYHISDGAEFTLIQIQNLNDGWILYNDCSGICDEGATFRRIQIVLGGGYTYMGEFCDLAGEKSRFICDIGYNIGGTHNLDMNYVADHHGRNSSSDIHVSGVMSDRACKVFRGTIDFHRGCAGAKGAEIEEVLLLDDTIENKTVPLILCDEEDVEGSHGATIGRLDENLIFYMKSRGIDEDEIYSMMAHARIDAVASLIPDMSVRDRVYEMISGPIERDCLKK